MIFNNSSEHITFFFIHLQQFHNVQKKFKKMHPQNLSISIYDDRKNIPNIYHHQEDSRVLLEKKQQLHWLFQYWKRSSIYWNYVKLDAFYVLAILNEK